MERITLRASKVSGAVVLLVLTACASEAPPHVQPTQSVWGASPPGQLDFRPPLGQLCLVATESCLSMNAPKAAPCLASPERCAAAGKLQFVGAAPNNAR